VFFILATTVNIYVKKDKVNDFILATIENHKGSVEETGNIRFDFMQDNNDPTHFTLYEVFEDYEAVARHKKTAHYLKWRETVQDWMEKPRTSTPHTIIVPTEIERW